MPLLFSKILIANRGEIARHGRIHDTVGERVAEGSDLIDFQEET